MIVLAVAIYANRELLWPSEEATPVPEPEEEEEELTPEDPDPTEPEEPEEEETVAVGGGPSYPPPPGEILLIEDGNYLLALVTKQTSLGDYEPEDLLPVPKEYSYHPEYQYYLREEALTQLLKMAEAAKAEGLNLKINSAFRSYDTQEGIFASNVAKYGEVKANRSSARPGQSEHQLGTTVDFGTKNAYLSQAFASEPEGIWLAENAYRFGFVMSYPSEESAAITGYVYEPWHFRYIGVEAALELRQSGEVLCEFLQKKPQFFVP